MSYTYGFFDAVDLGGGNFDRVYSSAEFSHYWALLVGDGVFGQPSTSLNVLAMEPVAMRVKVAPGTGWIKGHYLTVPDNMDEVILVPVANPSLPRIDSIIMALNNADRDMKLYLRSGTASVSPKPVTLQRDADVWELELAQITVAAGAGNISQTAIKDMRPDPNRCGIVTGLIDQFDVSGFFTAAQASFNEWFANIQNQLGEDVAGNLLNLIQGLTTRVDNLEGDIFTHPDFTNSVIQTGFGTTPTDVPSKVLQQLVDSQVKVGDYTLNQYIARKYSNRFVEANFATLDGSLRNGSLKGKLGFQQFIPMAQFTSRYAAGSSSDGNNLYPVISVAAHGNRVVAVVGFNYRSSMRYADSYQSYCLFQIKTSTDGGQTWSNSDTITGEQLLASGFDEVTNKWWIATCSSGTTPVVRYSTNGTSWTRNPSISGASRGLIYRVNAGGRLFFTGYLNGNQPCFDLSNNTWSPLPSPVNYSGQGKWVYSEDGKHIAMWYSTDTFYYSNNTGVSWTSVTMGNRSIHAATYGNGYWVIVHNNSGGTDVVVSRTNSTSLSDTYTTGYGGASDVVKSIIFKNGYFYVVLSGDASPYNPCMLVSTDGASWSKYPYRSIGNKSFPPSNSSSQAWWAPRPDTLVHMFLDQEYSLVIHVWKNNTLQSWLSTGNPVGTNGQPLAWAYDEDQDIFYLGYADSPSSSSSSTPYWSTWALKFNEESNSVTIIQMSYVKQFGRSEMMTNGHNIYSSGGTCSLISPYANQNIVSINSYDAQYFFHESNTMMKVPNGTLMVFSTSRFNTGTSSSRSYGVDLCCLPSYFITPLIDIGTPVFVCVKEAYDS